MRRDVPADTIDGQAGLFAFDIGTPICAGTWKASYFAAQCALEAACALQDGSTLSVSLARPPGHHASRDQYGGYCFLNHAAIAAQWLRDCGADRVAVLDVDYHHGNGTQSIFYDRRDVLTVSLHADPRTEYPYYLGHNGERGAGDGVGFHANYPIASGATWSEYAPALDDACARIERFAPDAWVVSFGADTFRDDPLGTFALDLEDYRSMGRRLAQVKRPLAVVMEGGYAITSLGEILTELLAGLTA